MSNLWSILKSLLVLISLLLVVYVFNGTIEGNKPIFFFCTSKELEILNNNFN